MLSTIVLYNNNWNFNYFCLKLVTQRIYQNYTKVHKLYKFCYHRDAKLCKLFDFGWILHVFVYMMHINRQNMTIFISYSHSVFFIIKIQFPSSQIPKVNNVRIYTLEIWKAAVMYLYRSYLHYIIELNKGPKIVNDILT